MPSIRQYYFKHINSIEASKNISKPQFLRLLCVSNILDNEASLFVHFDDEMQNTQKVDLIIERVLKGEMLEYLTNEAFFVDNYFYVNENVLIPRQETEELVDYFCKYFKAYKFSNETAKVADICTGSGCIAISIAKKCSLKNIYASDISKEALDVARINNEKLQSNVVFLQGNISDPFVESNIKLDCLICNPPYIKDNSTIDERTWNYEPHKALISDPDTYFYEYIIKNVDKLMSPKYLIGFEIGEEMKDSLSEIAKKYLPSSKIDFIKDMDGKWRFMFIYTNNEEIVSKAASSLQNHGVIAFPTETVMGLGVVYDDEQAFNKLNKVKGRPEGKPYSLMLGNVNDIEKYAYVSEQERKVINKFLPGPLTILLKKKELPQWVTLGSEYVGIRVPDLPIINETLNKLGKPILAPSANRSGEKPALTSDEVKDIFKDELDFIVPGEASNGLPSTIVIIENGVKVVRQGSITQKEIEEVIK